MADHHTPVTHTRAPWERLPDESLEDYKRFLTYRDAGPRRTQKDTARRHHITPAAISLVARAHQWKERARAWDTSQGRAKPVSDTVLRLADDRDAWEIQPGETERLYGYFQEYMKLGRTRTPRKTTEKINNQALETGAEQLARETVQHFSYRYRWPERAAAFDGHMDAQWRAALHEHGRRMVQEHLKVGRALLEKAQTAMDGIEPYEMTPSDLTKFVELYSKLTRVALGEPETSVAVTGASGGPVQFSSVPHDETARQQQMRAATLEIAKRLGVEAMELDAEAVLELPE